MYINAKCDDASSGYKGMAKSCERKVIFVVNLSVKRVDFDTASGLKRLYEWEGFNKDSTREKDNLFIYAQWLSLQRRCAQYHPHHSSRPYKAMSTSVNLSLYMNSLHRNLKRTFLKLLIRSTSVKDMLELFALL